MLKTMMVITLLSGDISRVEFDSMDKCLEHRQEVINQSNDISAVCIYQKKNKMDELAERVTRNLMVLVNAKLTQLLNEEVRK